MAQALWQFTNQHCIENQLWARPFLVHADNLPCSSSIRQHPAFPSLWLTLFYNSSVQYKHIKKYNSTSESAPRSPKAISVAANWLWKHTTTTSGYKKMLFAILGKKSLMNWIPSSRSMSGMFQRNPLQKVSNVITLDCYEYHIHAIAWIITTYFSWHIYHNRHIYRAYIKPV